MLIDAKFYDGITSDSQKVKLELWSDRLYIITGNNNYSWFYDKIIVQEKLSRHSDFRLSYQDSPDAQINISDKEVFAQIISKLPAQKTKVKYKPLFYYAVSIALLLFLVFYLMPAVSPAIAKYTPKKWEERIGAIATKAIIAENKICANPNGQQALEKLTKILAFYTKSDLKFTPIVINSSNINAFAAPAGNIIIYSQLIEKSASEAELAGILAHEMGHIVFRHGMENITRTLMTSFIIDVLTGGGGSSLYLGAQAFNLKYSRTKEAEADAYALEILTAANINPQGLYDFFSKIDGEENQHGTLLDFLSTHPSNTARISSIRNAINKNTTYNNVLSEDEWQSIKLICK